MVLPVYTLLRASILGFRARLGNRCMVLPVYTLLRASILDFKPRLWNRCMVLPVYPLLRASILDFRARVANRCSTIVAAVRNGFACGGRRGCDFLRPTLIFVAAEKNGPPATAVATTIFRVRF